MKTEKRERGRPLLLFIFIAYISVLFYVVFLAWNHGSSFGLQGPGGRNYNLDPFLSIYRIAVYSENWQDPLIILGGNVLLFIPFGCLFPALMNWSRLSEKAGFIKTAAAAAVLSTFIETVQYLFTYRVANVDDVILNTVGGAVGYLMYAALRHFFNRTDPSSVNDVHKR
ncbi:VanZ family protein [Alkalicoccus luteus]|uniref:VanZ family protein n=1 Tax=Alkalicoccus luteus TaxID=1237094 RepID=A0A969PX29_9BACI|nr:VanZ family protein [Alkalicoccus luteus]NJP37217.1 VanZ family protein [Alkalicoccus luteus]